MYKIIKSKSPKKKPKEIDLYYDDKIINEDEEFEEICSPKVTIKSK